MSAEDIYLIGDGAGTSRHYRGMGFGMRAADGS